MTDSMIPPTEDDDTGEFSPGDTYPEERPHQQFELIPERRDAYYKTREYKLACFIMGCLIQEEVVSTSDHNDLGSSDMAIGIQIIAACLEGNLDPEGFPDLPFEW